jgi:hypothetical protein
VTQVDPVARAVRAGTVHFTDFALVSSAATPTPAAGPGAGRRLLLPRVELRALGR